MARNVVPDRVKAAARQAYVAEGMSILRISDGMGLNRSSLYRWKDREDWDRLRQELHEEAKRHLSQSQQTTRQGVLAVVPQSEAILRELEEIELGLAYCRKKMGGGDLNANMAHYQQLLERKRELSTTADEDPREAFKELTKDLKSLARNLGRVLGIHDELALQALEQAIQEVGT